MFFFMSKMIKITRVIDKQLVLLISTIEHYNFPGCSQLTSRDDRPVCGTDGRTYGNKSYLDRAACNTQNPDLAVAYQGKCTGITLYDQHIDLQFFLY